MNRFYVRITPINRWLEPILALLILGGSIYALWHLYARGYLPQPFFYDPYDMWMDWFNVAWWAHNGGAYTRWGTTYPPLSFIITGLLGDSYCYMDTGPYAYGARACDWFGRVTVHALYAVNVILIARLFYLRDRATALPRSIAAAFGLPLLGALERGNLILPTITAVLVAIGPFSRRSWVRWLGMAFAINFKVYLIAALFPQLLRRRWRWFEGALITTILVYLGTYLLLGEGTPFQVFDNIVAYSTGGASTTFLDAWFASTYQPLLSLLNSLDIPIMSILGSMWVNAATVAIRGLTLTVQLSVVAACAAAWIRPEAVPMYRLTNLGICLAIFTSEAGGYALLFPMIAAFMERWEGFGRKLAIIAAYVVAVSFDIIVDSVPPVVREVYFSSTTEEVQYHIMAGPFVRPAIGMLIPIALSWVTIHQVWQDIDRQAWKQRWRFRRDLPIMVGDGRAEPPGASATPR